MKPGSSTLNPSALSYIPLSRRMGGNVDKDKDLNLVKESGSGNETVWLGNEPVNEQEQHVNVYPSSFPNAGDFQTAENSKWKGNHGDEFYASSSSHQIGIEKSTSDEEFDMHIAYLQMTFPGTSLESITGVYLASRCDLDATIDMLNLLEPNPVDFSDELPESLDIGDVPESGPSSALAPQKLKNVTTEATGSMSSDNLPSAN